MNLDGTPDQDPIPDDLTPSHIDSANLYSPTLPLSDPAPVSDSAAVSDLRSFPSKAPTEPAPRFVPFIERDQVGSDDPFQDRTRRILKARLVPRQAPSGSTPSQPLESGDSVAEDGGVKIPLVISEALTKRLKGRAPVVSSLVALIVLTFLVSIAGKDWDQSYFWWTMLEDRALVEDDLIETGAMTISSVNQIIEYPRLILSLFQHSGPWSLFLILGMLFGAGRFLERLLGGGQTLFLFLFTGFIGNFVSLSVAQAAPGTFFFVAGAWAGCFGLLGAQGGVLGRGLAAGVPLQRGRGILGSLIMIWLISAFHFFPDSFDPRTLAPIGLGLIAAAVAGGIVVRILPAWVDEPLDSGCAPLFFGFLSMFIVTSALLIWAVDSSTASNEYVIPKNGRRSINGQRRGRLGSGQDLGAGDTESEVLANFKLTKDKDHGFVLQLPNAWKEIRRGDNFVSYGSSTAFGAYQQEKLYLYTRDQHPYDAPDTLIGRFLNMSLGDWGLSQKDMTIIEDGPFDHPRGQAYHCIYRLKRGNRSIRAGIQRCHYVIVDGQVFFFLFHGQMDDDRGEISGTIVKSVKVLGEEEEKTKDKKD
jgi:membrane associated rhomboid family serine protease